MKIELDKLFGKPVASHRKWEANCFYCQEPWPTIEFRALKPKGTGLLYQCCKSCWESPYAMKEWNSYKLVRRR
jgi:hypothetical protein